MENLKSAYLVYTGLGDESIEPYIGEIRNLLHALECESIDPARFLFNKLYLSSSETNDELVFIEKYLEEASFIIEIVRGNDAYKLRLKDPQSEFAMKWQNTHKKPLIVLFPYYRCGKQEFEQLSEEKKAVFLEGIPSGSILIRSISELAGAIKRIKHEII